MLINCLLTPRMMLKRVMKNRRQARTAGLVSMPQSMVVHSCQLTGGIAAAYWAVVAVVPIVLLEDTGLVIIDWGVVWLL